MNWGRVRGENLVSSRGSESIFEENWGPPSTASPRKKKKKKRNKAKSSTVADGGSTLENQAGGTKAEPKRPVSGKRRIGFAKARGERLQELRRYYADALSKGQHDRVRALKSQIQTEERKQKPPSQEKLTQGRGRSTARAKAKRQPKAVAWAIPV